MHVVVEVVVVVLNKFGPVISTPLVEFGVKGGASADLLMIEPAPLVAAAFYLDSGTHGWGRVCPFRDFLTVWVEYLLIGFPRIEGPFRVHILVLNEIL